MPVNLTLLCIFGCLSGVYVTAWFPSVDLSDLHSNIQ